MAESWEDRREALQAIEDVLRTFGAETEIKGCVVAPPPGVEKPSEFFLSVYDGEDELCEGYGFSLEDAILALGAGAQDFLSSYNE